jgi:hypothetical protein
VYHNVGTALKYHTVGTALKYHTVGTALKYHTVGTALKSNRTIIERCKIDTHHTVLSSRAEGLYLSYGSVMLSTEIKAYLLLSILLIANHIFTGCVVIVRWRG